MSAYGAYTLKIEKEMYKRELEVILASEKFSSSYGGYNELNLAYLLPSSFHRKIYNVIEIPLSLLLIHNPVYYKKNAPENFFFEPHIDTREKIH